jgi:hypothetical protein
MRKKPLIDSLNGSTLSRMLIQVSAFLRVYIFAIALHFSFFFVSPFSGWNSCVSSSLSSHISTLLLWVPSLPPWNRRRISFSALDLENNENLCNNSYRKFRFFAVSFCALGFDDGIFRSKFLRGLVAASFVCWRETEGFLRYPWSYFHRLLSRWVEREVWWGKAEMGNALEGLRLEEK